MKEAITYVYNYLSYKPHIGLLSAVTSYLIAIKTVVLTDDILKIIGTISTCAGCIVACLSALSMLVKSATYMIKFYKSLKAKKRS